MGSIREIKPEGCSHLAAELRKLADDVEAGTLTDVVIVGNDRGNGAFYRMAHFDDSWRMLGAIEYAKATVILANGEWA